MKLTIKPSEMIQMECVHIFLDTSYDVWQWIVSHENHGTSTTKYTSDDESEANKEACKLAYELNLPLYKESGYFHESYLMSPD